jgi:hypothetical protein
MTLEALFAAMSSAPLATLLVFLFPPLYAFVLRFLHGPGEGGLPPWRYLYAVLVYLTTIPGVFIAAVTAYLLLAQGTNLIKLDLLVFFLPVVSMIITLILVRTRVSFKDIPGFKRLSGLLLMLAAAFAVALIIDHLRIIVLFHGSILWLFGIAAVIFIALKIGISRLFRKKPGG